MGADEARQQLGTARLGEVLLCAARGHLRARLAQVDLGKVSCVSCVRAPGKLGPIVPPKGAAALPGAGQYGPWHHWRA